MRPLSRYLLAPLMLVLGAWSGCTTNPLKTAATAQPDARPETIALATFGLFTIAEETAADLKELPATPQSAKDALKEADRAVSPAMESMRDVAVTIQGLRRVAAAGGTGGEALPAKLAELNQLLIDTAPKLDAFTKAVNAAKKGPTP